MIETATLYRPGLTAIAAVLALSSTSAFAQLALPDVAAPAAPVAAAPVAAPAAQAPVQTVQSVPATPTLPDIAVADAPAVAAPARAVRQRAEAPAQPAARQVSERQTASRAEPAQNAAPAAAPAAPVAPPMAAESADVAPSTPPVEQATPAPARAEANAADDMGYAGWVLLGGGLLIVAGGAAFALSRRPKRRAADADYAVPVAPIMPEAVARQPEAYAQPVMATRVAREEPRRPRAAVHSESLDDRQAMLEAMIAEAPSKANPFHSRRNRLRRTDFLLRTGQAEEAGFAPAAQSHEEPAMATDRWSEMRFGGNQNARVSWKKPVTTR